MNALPRVLAASFLAACCTSPSKPGLGEDVTAYVSARGSDEAAGTRDAPFATIPRALRDPAIRRLVLEGEFARLEVVRPLRIEGGRVTELVVRAEATIAGTAVGALEAREASLTLEGARLERALIESSRARLRDARCKSDADVCLEIATSTVVLEGVEIEGRAKRGLHAKSSSVTARRLVVRGASLAQVQVEGGALHLVDASLEDGLGAGLTALEAKVAIDRTRIERHATIGLVARRSTIEARDLAIGGSGDLSIGVQGGALRLTRAHVTASGRGSVNLGAYLEERPSLAAIDSRFEHGGLTAIAIGAGHAEVTGCRFVGGPGKEDAITAHGAPSELSVERTIFERPAGFAIAVFDDATLRGRSLTVDKPALGGLMFETVAGATVAVDGAQIRGCTAGSGVVALDALGVRLEGIEISGCAEAGILAGAGARVVVAGARLLDNRLYGVAAFGGAEVEVRSGEIRGGARATFATCGEGSNVRLEPGVETAGPVERCP